MANVWLEQNSYFCCYFISLTVIISLNKLWHVLKQFPIKSYHITFSIYLVNDSIGENIYPVYLNCFVGCYLQWVLSVSLIDCPFTVANFSVNSLYITFFMKSIAEVLCIFNVTSLILWQTTGAHFGNILIIDIFATLDNSEKWLSKTNWKYGKTTLYRQIHLFIGDAFHVLACTHYQAILLSIKIFSDKHISFLYH